VENEQFRKSNALRRRAPNDEAWSGVSPRSRVLVVDDLQANHSLIDAYLEPLGCDLVHASSGQAALEAVEAAGLDLILLDVQMPGLNGFEVCARLKREPSTRLVPIVMVTALSAVDDRVRALEAGADDFLTKPVDRVELVARVRSLLRLKATYDRLEDSEQVIYSLARAVEAKDRYTQAHTARVAGSARRLGEILGLGEAVLEDLYRGGVIHDIGKIGVPDQILLKARALSSSEMAIMREHPSIGEEIIRPLRSATSLRAIVRHHHESFDGTGYPDRLRGSDIPLLARIVAVCDAFDALVSDRPYRRRLASEQALEVLRRGAASQWDPQLVEIFTTQVATVQVA